MERGEIVQVPDCSYSWLLKGEELRRWDDCGHGQDMFERIEVQEWKFLATGKFPEDPPEHRNPDFPNDTMLIGVNGGALEGCYLYINNKFVKKTMTSLSARKERNERLRGSLEKWQNVEKEVINLRDVWGGNCQYCEEFDDFHRDGHSEDNEWEDCPLAESCGACLEDAGEGDEDSHYSMFTYHIQRAEFHSGRMKRCIEEHLEEEKRLIEERE